MPNSYKLMHDRTSARARYYLLSPTGESTSYVGIEHYDNIVEMKPRFILPPKKVETEVTTLFTLFPMNAAALWLFSNFLRLNVEKVVDKDGLEPESIYHTWDSTDITELSKMYQSFEEKTYFDGKESSWEFPKTTKNAIVNAFVEDGYTLFGVKHIHRFLKQYWLVRTSKRGFLNVVLLYEAGGVDTFTPKVDCYAFPREAVEPVVAEIAPAPTEVTETEKGE